ncbi:MAG: hypothetical protein JJD98_00335 [Polaromonas sp.]|nr:hypothetical protein [Polaromonas sp.]
MTTFITRSGLQVGLLYQRPMPAIHGDGYLLQTALLDPRSAQPLSLLMRVLGRVWQWL